MKRIIDQEQKPIRDIWVTNLYIPIYQREFVWDDEHIQNSIKTIFDDKNSKIESYMGNILIVEKEKNGKKILEIVDGQQRTIFSFLFIKSIYELLNEIQEKISSEKENEDFKLIINEYKIKAKNLILIENEDDRIQKNHFSRVSYASKKLNEVILGVLEGIDEFSIENKFKKNKKFRISKSLDKIKNLIFTTINTPNEPSMNGYKILGDDNRLKNISKELFKLFDFFTNNVKYIEIKLIDDKYSTEIFERMNSTSKPLTDYELFKNYISGKLISIDDSEEITDSENKISAIDDIVNDNKLDSSTIIRSLLYYKNGNVTKSKYKFHELKKIYNNLNSPKEMYDEVISLLNNYSRLENNNLDSKEYFSFLPYQIIKIYNFKQLKSPFIAMTLKYGHTEENAKLFMALISIVFKRVVLGGEVANIIENLLFKIFNEENTLINPKLVIEKLKNETIYSNSINIDISQSNFSSISKNEFIKILWLYSINESSENFSTLFDKNLEVTINFDKVQIEHIFPRSWEKNWHAEASNLNKQDILDLIDNPGNKMPILGKYNIQASNKSFLEKKEKYYIKSSLNKYSNKDHNLQDKWFIHHVSGLSLDEVFNSKKWTKKEIENRSINLKEKFLQNLNRYLNEI